MTSTSNPLFGTRVANTASLEAEEKAKTREQTLRDTHKELSELYYELLLEEHRLEEVIRKTRQTYEAGAARVTNPRLTDIFMSGKKHEAMVRGVEFLAEEIIKDSGELKIVRETANEHKAALEPIIEEFEDLELPVLYVFPLL